MVVRHQMAQLTPTINAFETAFGRLPSVLVRSPGRVNLLGAHLDYNDGCVLPVAIDREIWLAGQKLHVAKQKGRQTKVATKQNDRQTKWSPNENGCGLK